MSANVLIYIGMTIGSIIGGYLPTFFGAGLLSFTSLFFSSVGAVVGILIGYKLSKY